MTTPAATQPCPQPPAGGDLDLVRVGSLRLAAAGTSQAAGPVRSTGPAVIWVQRVLAARAGEAIQDDGKFGPLTGAAVARFKRSRGISPADPVVGPLTLRALEAACAAAPPGPGPAPGPNVLPPSPAPAGAPDWLGMLRRATGQDGRSGSLTDVAPLPGEVPLGTRAEISLRYVDPVAAAAPPASDPATVVRCRAIEGFRDTVGGLAFTVVPTGRQPGGSSYIMRGYQRVGPRRPLTTTMTAAEAMAVSGARLDPGQAPDDLLRAQVDVWHDLSGNEGDPTAINAYDSANLTWGGGFAAAGQLQTLLSTLMRRSADARTLLHAAGVSVEHVTRRTRARTGATVTVSGLEFVAVDCARGWVLVGDDAERLIRCDRRILSLFVRIAAGTVPARALPGPGDPAARNSALVTATLDAQFLQLITRSGRISGFALRPPWTRALRAAVAHNLHFGGLAAGWADFSGTNGDPVEVVRTIARKAMSCDHLLASSRLRFEGAFSHGALAGAAASFPAGNPVCTGRARAIRVGSSVRVVPLAPGVREVGTADESGPAPAPYLLRSALLAGDQVLSDVAGSRLRLAAPGTRPFPAPVLSAGPAIRKVQLALAQLGRLDPRGADGRFGPVTGVAVARYKRERAISPADPVVGPKTIEALDRELLARRGPKPAPVPVPPVPVPPSLPELERRYFPSGGTDAAPFSRTSVARPLIDGADFFGALLGQIRGLIANGGPGDAWYVAGWTIDAGFQLDPARPEKLVDLLDAVARRGVDVRVIAWASDTLLNLDRFSSPVQDVIRRNAGAFIPVVEGNVASIDQMRARRSLANRCLLDWSGNQASSHHMKLNVFLRRGQLTAFASGMDLARNRLDGRDHPPTAPGNPGRPVPWHDAAVMLRGEAAARVHETFRTRWFEARTLNTRTFRLRGGAARVYNPPGIVMPDPPTRSATVPPSPDTSVAVLRSVPDSKEFNTLVNRRWDRWPRSGVHEVQRTLTQALAAARRYIYVEDQAFDATDVLFPLLKRACERGVKVIAVLPGILDEPGRPVVGDQLNPAVANLVASISPAARTNLAVWHLVGVIVHSKVVVIDDEFYLVGSANFMDRSMNHSGFNNVKGDDSECSAAVVGLSAARRLRVDLWAEHLRVRANRAAEAELADLSRVIGFWRPGWGGAPTFRHPSSPLRFVGPLKGTTGTPVRPAGAVPPSSSSSFSSKKQSSELAQAYGWEIASPLPS